MPEPVKRSRTLRAARASAFAGVAVVAVGAVAALAAAAAIWPRYVQIRTDADAMAKAHADHTVSHPGWSFPGTVWSAASDLDGMSKERRALHAKARGYASVCPPTAPGDFCAKTGDVMLRGGHFAEGDQPPGNDSWTRPLAFEPVMLGAIVGPDAEMRWHLPLADAPDHLVAAILAAEDESFRAHPGVDFGGLLRATFRNAQGGGYKQGASTLTMQLVRNLTQSKEKSIERKLTEIAQALAVDGSLGKDQVLGMYLDAPYLGQAGNLSVCGFEAAARYYWGKHAKDLTLDESATLAAILPAPGKFAPDRDPIAAKERRDRVLTRMAELGWDTTDALAQPIDASPHELLPPDRYGTYLQATRLAISSTLAPEIAYGAGLDVFTAMDVAAQSQTEALLDERIQHLERTTGRRGTGPLTLAVALVDPATGLLVAAHDTNQGTATDFSRVTQARRQGGSSFKPVVFALAFSPGPDGKALHRADDTVPNTWRDFAGTNGWRPKNIAGRYSATVSYAYGLTASMNIATASVLEASGGPDALIKLATKIGFDTSKFPHEMGISLGQAGVTPLEMARFAGTVIGGGKKLTASPVALAIDADGTRVYEATPPADQVLTPEAAVLTRELMALVVGYGTGGAARGGGGFPGYEGQLIGKTGTSDAEKDLWYIGGTPTYAGAMWLGYDQPTDIGGSASDLTSPAFGWWMRAVHEGLPLQKFDKLGVTPHWLCTQTGLVAAPGCQVLPTPLLPDQTVRGVCSGTHAPETGISMRDHISLWERIEYQRLAREQGIPLASDNLPVTFPVGPDGLPVVFVRPKPVEGAEGNPVVPVVVLPAGTPVDETTAN